MTQITASQVNEIPAEPAPIATPVVKLSPAAKGTAIKVSDPLHTVLAVAELVGTVHRGGQIEQATATQLRALAKRGYLDLVIQMHGRRPVIVGGAITSPGRIRLAELNKVDAEAARMAANVAYVLAINIAA